MSSVNPGAEPRPELRSGRDPIEGSLPEQFDTEDLRKASIRSPKRMQAPKDDPLKTRLTETLGIEYPIICGAMYPCSSPELVSAASEAGGIGIVQPLSFVYVWERDFRQALQEIKSKTSKPFGMNVLILEASKRYDQRMREWVDIALEEGCRFFITALGKPDWVVEKVKPHGGVVFHNTTERKWAEKAVAAGVDGFICINDRAGGHAGSRSPEALKRELEDFGLPMICAGGVGDEQAFADALRIGYDGVQMGTRFIATEECQSHPDYKEAIVRANKNDIVLTERVDGYPLSVIRTPHVDLVGTTIGPLARLLFKFPATKKLMRAYYAWRAAKKMKNTSLKGMSTKDYYQAGKSAEGVRKVEPVRSIVERFVSFAREKLSAEH